MSKEMEAVLKLMGKLDPSVTQSFNQVKSKMTELNKTAKINKTALASVNEALKLKPTSIELIHQKQQLLQSSIQTTTQRLQAQKQALAELEAGEQNPQTIQQQAKLRNEIAKTEQELKKLKREFRTFQSDAGAMIQGVGEKMQQLGTKISQVGDNLMRTGAQMSLISAPLLLFGKTAVTSYNDVNKEMRLIQQTMGSTAKEADMLNSAIEKAASNSTFGMQEATDAALNFARAGFDATQTAEMIAPAMALASGTATDLSATTSGLSGALVAFGADSTEAAHYTDVFAQAASNADVTVQDLFDAVETAGPICKTVGWDLNELAVITDVFGKHEISGSEGANALKTGLSRLSSPTKDAQVWLDKFGTSLYDSEGKMKSFQEVQKTLHDSFQGLTTEEKMQAATALFGKNQMSKWLALIEESPEEVAKLAASLEDCNGKAQDMSDAMVTPLERMKSTFDVFKYEVGAQLMEALEPAFEKLTGLMQKFMDLPDGVKKTIVKIGAFIAVLGPALIAIGAITKGVGGFITGIGSVFKIVGKTISIFKSLKTAISVAGMVIKFLGASFGWLPLIIIGVIAAIVLVIKNWDKLKEAGQKCIDALKSAWQAFVGFFKGIGDSIKGVADSVSQWWDSAKEALSSKWDSIKSAASDKWNGIKETIQNAWDGLDISGKWDEIKSKLSEKWDSIKEAASQKWDAIKNIFKGKDSGGEDPMAGISQSADNANSKISLLSTAGTNAMAALSTATAGAKSAFEFLQTGAQTAWTGISTAAQTAWSAVTTATTTATATLQGAVSGAMSAVSGAVSTCLNTVRSLFTSVWNSAVSIVQGAVGRLKAAMNFSWSLPHLALPHISVSGKFSINPPSAPHFSISWYRKAMSNGMILNNPTIFGMMNGHLLGAGEAGPEVVAGAGSLSTMIQRSVAAGMNWGSSILDEKDLGYPAQVGMMLNNGYTNAGNPVYVGGATNQTRTVHVGGITFAPQIKVETPAGSTSKMDEKTLIKLLRKYEPELVDMLVNAIEERGDGAFVEPGWVY